MGPDSYNRKKFWVQDRVSFVFHKSLTGVHGVESGKDSSSRAESFSRFGSILRVSSETAAMMAA